MGSIFYTNFNSNSTIKIISSHKNCFINSISCNSNDGYILTSADDGTVRCWTQDTFDQKYQIIKLDEIKCDEVLLNQSENICSVIYDTSFIRIYNLDSLKSLGKIKIPEFDISHMSFIFNDQGILVTTLQDKLFVMDVQNWDPLNVLYTEIDNLSLPKNQFYKSIDTKNINPTKTLAALSFSDGTCCVIMIEKNLGKIETSAVDIFNMFEYHIKKSDDMFVGEMYKNLKNLRVRNH
jgi:WD40 repeat protein